MAIRTIVRASRRPHHFYPRGHAAMMDKLLIKLFFDGEEDFSGQLARDGGQIGQVETIANRIPRYCITQLFRQKLTANKRSAVLLVGIVTALLFLVL